MNFKLELTLSFVKATHAMYQYGIPMKSIFREKLYSFKSATKACMVMVHFSGFFLFICPFFPALSALFKVDGALRRVGGENDYIYYAGKHGILKILKK